MSNETAVTPTDSAPVTPSLPELSSLSQEQRATWRRSGELPSKQDSAPVKEAVKEDAVADSAPQKDSKEQKPAVNASDSAPEKQSQPHRKTKEDTERRIQELLDRVKKAEERAEAAERRTSEKRDSKPESQPVPKAEEYKPLDEKQWFKDNSGKTYEDFVRAAARHEAKWEAEQQIKQSEQRIRQQIAQEAAAKELQSKVKDANERYGKEEAAKIFPSLEQIVSDEKIPYAVKAMLNDSDVLVDLVYTLASDPAEFTKFVDLSKSNPAAAIRKLVTVESMVRDTLTSKEAKPERGTDGKFKPKAEEVKEVAAEPVTRAPRPPVEVGGHTAVPQDGALSAVKSNDFRRAKEAFTREYAASHKL